MHHRLARAAAVGVPVALATLACARPGAPADTDVVVGRADEILPVVEDDTFARELAEQSTGDDRPVFRPLVDGLQVGYVFSTPAGERFVDVDDLHRLGLDADDADEQAKVDLAAMIEPIDGERLHPDAGVEMLVTGDGFEASRLVLLDWWEPVAGRVQGDLVVVAPARDVVFWTGDGVPRDVDALREVADAAFVREKRPIEPVLLRWSPTGWERVDP